MRKPMHRIGDDAIRAEEERRAQGGRFSEREVGQVVAAAANRSKDRPAEQSLREPRLAGPDAREALGQSLARAFVRRRRPIVDAEETHVREPCR